MGKVSLGIKKPPNESGGVHTFGVYSSVSPPVSNVG